jgi:hypothetical protein
MIVLWLASLGANAAFRSGFTIPVDDAQCYNDGSAVNSNHCVYKRDYLAGSGALAWLSAVAGISAVMLLLFVATFAYVAHFFRLEWARHSTGTDAEKASGVAAPAAAPIAPVAGADQSQPFLNQQQQQYQQQQPQWAQQQQQQQQQQHPAPYSAQNTAYDPYTQQNTSYVSSQSAYHSHVPHELPSPQGTPAPGQPYYPPQ